MHTHMHTPSQRQPSILRAPLSTNICAKRRSKKQKLGRFFIHPCACACVHACVCACVRAAGVLYACVRACVRACVFTGVLLTLLFTCLLRVYYVFTTCLLRVYRSTADMTTDMFSSGSSDFSSGFCDMTADFDYCIPPPSPLRSI